LLLAAKAKAATVDEYGESPLSLACANGNPLIVGKLLKAGADPNVSRWNGESPLMIAARFGNPEVLRLLIEHGAAVDAVESRKGQDALIWAAAEGHADAVEVLLKAGAKPNTISKGGFSPLIFTASYADYLAIDQKVLHGAL
jgi:ankyrin repeat protein